MGFKLESLHLYRKVPRDLTDATSVGGAISLVCAMVMAYLFVSNINDYLKMQTTTDVALDDTGEVSMRIFFNITMERLPCQVWLANPNPNPNPNPNLTLTLTLTSSPWWTSRTSWAPR